MVKFANAIKMWEPCDELVEECRGVLSRMITVGNIWKMIECIGNNAFFQDTCYQVSSSQLNTNLSKL